MLQVNTTAFGFEDTETNQLNVNSLPYVINSGVYKMTAISATLSTVTRKDGQVNLIRVRAQAAMVNNPAEHGIITVDLTVPDMNVPSSRYGERAFREFCFVNSFISATGNGTYVPALNFVEKQSGFSAETYQELQDFKGKEFMGIVHYQGSTAKGRPYFRVDGFLDAQGRSAKEMMTNASTHIRLDQLLDQNSSYFIRSEGRELAFPERGQSTGGTYMQFPPVGGAFGAQQSAQTGGYQGPQLGGYQAPQSGGYQNVQPQAAPRNSFMTSMPQGAAAAKPTALSGFNPHTAGGNAAAGVVRPGVSAQGANPYAATPETEQIPF